MACSTYGASLNFRASYGSSHYDLHGSMVDGEDGIGHQNSAWMLLDRVFRHGSPHITSYLEECSASRLLVDLVALEPTRPNVTILTPDLAPVPADSAEIARRLGVQGWTGARGVVRQRRFGEEGLHDALRGRGWDVRLEERVVVPLGFDQLIRGGFFLLFRWGGLWFCFGGCSGGGRLLLLFLLSRRGLRFGSCWCRASP